MPRRVSNISVAGTVFGAVMTVVTTIVSALLIYIELTQNWIPSKADVGFIFLFLAGPSIFWAYFSPGIWFKKDEIVLEYLQHRNRGSLNRAEITGFYIEDKSGVRLHPNEDTLENVVIIITLLDDKTRAYPIQKLKPKKLLILNEEFGRGHLLP